jgi:hypothetical protein
MFGQLEYQTGMGKKIAVCFSELFNATASLDVPSNV